MFIKVTKFIKIKYGILVYKYSEEKVSYPSVQEPVSIFKGHHGVSHVSTQWLSNSKAYVTKPFPVNFRAFCKHRRQRP
jgi:maltodextrin utilization protein YvdJ